MEVSSILFVFFPYQNGVEKRMNHHAGQAKDHVADMVDELMICDDFQQMPFKCAMVAH